MGTSDLQGLQLDACLHQDSMYGLCAQDRESSSVLPHRKLGPLFPRALEPTLVLGSGHPWRDVNYAPVLSQLAETLVIHFPEPDVCQMLVTAGHP